MSRSRSDRHFTSRSAARRSDLANGTGIGTTATVASHEQPRVLSHVISKLAGVIAVANLCVPGVGELDL